MRIQYPPLRIVRFSGESFSVGIEEHRSENIFYVALSAPFILIAF
jgi:hypothetical protein